MYLLPLEIIGVGLEYLEVYSQVKNAEILGSTNRCQGSSSCLCKIFSVLHLGPASLLKVEVNLLHLRTIKFSYNLFTNFPIPRTRPKGLFPNSEVAF